MIEIGFLGSHPLGEACLQRLYDNSDINVVGVVTYSQDHDHWWDGSLWEQANELGLKVHTINNSHKLLESDFDWLLSVYYPIILDEDWLDFPREGALNLHQAELPRYRGSNVFSHSIMNARVDNHWKHGTTLHFMEPKVDSGDVVARRFVEISEDDTARTLYEKVSNSSVRLFEEQLPHIVSGKVHELRTPQKSMGGKKYFYKKDSLKDLKGIEKENIIDGNEVELYDRVRALDFPPHEPAWIRLNGEKVYLTKEGYERF